MLSANRCCEMRSSWTDPQKQLQFTKCKQGLRFTAHIVPIRQSHVALSYFNWSLLQMASHIACSDFRDYRMGQHFQIVEQSISSNLFNSPRAKMWLKTQLFLCLTWPVTQADLKSMLCCWCRVLSADKTINTPFVCRSSMLAWALCQTLYLLQFDRHSIITCNAKTRPLPCW